MSFIIYADARTMTDHHQKAFGLAATFADAVAVSDGWGAGTRIGIGITEANILAPAGKILQPAEAIKALKFRAAKYIFTFGNHMSAPDCFMLAPIMETLVEQSGAGFMAACFAMPSQGRTVFQGHLFQGAHLKENLVQALSNELSSRVGLVSHSITANGAQAIRARLAALKDQGYALALVDAVTENDCTAVAEAFASTTITAGPAWISSPQSTEAAEEDIGPMAILSGALDRQTLFQIGAAAVFMPVLQLDFTKSANEIIAGALDWASLQTATFIIAASAPPGRVTQGAAAAEILGAIAMGLAAAGANRFMLTGNDTAVTILNYLGETRLTAGAANGPLRWLHGRKSSFLIKPGGVGAKDLYQSLIGPQICLNAAAE